MIQHFSIDKPARMLVFFGFSVAFCFFALYMRVCPELYDDGAFFLRYAENMVKGEFWVWNLGEAPIWGASAPLYPLVIAMPMALGLSPEASIIGVGLTLSTLSLAAVALMLGHRFGIISGIAFLVLSALDSNLMWFSSAGLETPLTIALLAFAVWTLLYPSHSWIIGVAAGLLMVNKLDLIPVGGLLLLAHGIQDKKFPKVAFMIATTLALLWYGFAWWYFGAPVPNSFLTKALHQNDHPKSIDWTWFAGVSLWRGIHKWLTAFSLLAFWRKSRDLFPLVIFLGGTLIVHLAAYTIKYPFEPYNWYTIPAVFALLIGAALGVSEFIKLIRQIIPNKTWLSGIIITATILLIVVSGVFFEKNIAAHIKVFTSHKEYDRAEAGRWVAKNTPKNFRVFTMWGNPAYYSQRYVLDGSFLNRKFENVSLVQKYKPEILIMQNNPGSTPWDPVFAFDMDKGYRVVKVFDKTYLAGMDYFFAVLARKDVVGQLKNIEFPRNLMPFIKNIELGDQFGNVKSIGNGTVFVHPGVRSPTRFDIDLAALAMHIEQMTVKLKAAISPDVPDEAINRGGANVRIKLISNSNQISESIIKVGHPYQIELPIEQYTMLTVIVDNNGNADTDWMLFSIK